VKVPANDRVEVRFPVKTDAAGTARYRISATHDADADSASGEFPVYTPVTTEAFATYGVVDDGAIAQPVQTPTGVVPQYGGLEIDTSSTGMPDAVVYPTINTRAQMYALNHRAHVAAPGVRRAEREACQPVPGGRVHQR
jgi:hypothetical protein